MQILVKSDLDIIAQINEDTQINDIFRIITEFLRIRVKCPKGPLIKKTQSIESLIVRLCKTILKLQKLEFIPKFIEILQYLIQFTYIKLNSLFSKIEENDYLYMIEIKNYINHEAGLTHESPTPIDYFITNYDVLGILSKYIIKINMVSLVY
jgi:hypothetical protein